MSERLLVEAVNDALHVEMERDESVMVMGEDVGRLGGVFRATAGLPGALRRRSLRRHAARGGGDPRHRCRLCMAGWRPVCEMQYDAFSYPALDQLINHVGRYRWRTRGKMSFPITIRMPYGGGVRAPELHDDSPETYYVHTPGVKVAIRRPRPTRRAPRGRDPRPRPGRRPRAQAPLPTAKEEVPDGEHVVPLGKARVAREGSDIDDRRLRRDGAVSLAPRMRWRARPRRGARPPVASSRSTRRLLASVAKTGRVVVVQEAPRVCGFAAEVAAVLAEKAIFDLQGPVIRVTGYDVPYPYWQIEDAYMPSVERVVDAARRVLAS